MRRRLVPVAAAAAAIAAGLLLSGCTSPSPMPTPSASTTPAADLASDIQVGDCLNDAGLSGVVTTVPFADCDEPHDSEAYAAFDLDEGAYPGDAAINVKGDEGCVAAFATFIGIPYNESKLSYSFYHPTESSWSQGDRRILCEVFDGTSQTTGTLEGAAR
jgi:hypothetical protein